MNSAMFRFAELCHSPSGIVPIKEFGNVVVVVAFDAAHCHEGADAIERINKALAPSTNPVGRDIYPRLFNPSVN